MRLEGGQNVGERYTLVRRIGSGGMADVWLADDSMLGRQVALKFLHERFTQDPQFIERFRREAQAAAGLQHPNVVGVYDRGETDGRHWIAMEYVDGAGLGDLIQRGLNQAEAIEITRQILAGARFAHERGIIHRDLKPQNVMVDAEGRARVTDFGIARAGASEITQTGSVLGTAQYLSPEQAQGFEVQAPSDLYSIGVILYEALTGHVPFEGDTAVVIALKQVSEQPRPPSALNPEVPRSLDAVVLRALAKDPAARFATAGEFLEALDAAEADPSGGTLGRTAVYAAGVGAAGAALASGEAADAAQGEEDEGGYDRRKLIALGVIAALIAAVVVFALTRSEQKRVPTVIGETESEAERILERAGFDPFSTTFESCDEPNTVAEQDPRAGDQADEGSEVTLSVSLGQSVRVPNVVGDPIGEATKRLHRDELLVNERRVFSGNTDSGSVVRTDPSIGEQVPCQSAVTVFVSKGPNLVTVPSLLGLEEAEASSQLRELGLLPNIESENSDEPEGTVIGQDPGPDSRLEKGTEVQLMVSNGAGTVVMPNVEGQPRDTAIATLRGRGANNIKVIEQETDVQSDDDRVTDQAPSAGTRIRAGDQVTIFVAVYVEPEEEPPPEEAPEEEPSPRERGRAR